MTILSCQYVLMSVRGLTLLLKYRILMEAIEHDKVQRISPVEITFGDIQLDTAGATH